MMRFTLGLMWFDLLVAALPRPDQSLRSACRRALGSKAELELALIVCRSCRRLGPRSDDVLILLFCGSEPARESAPTVTPLYLPTAAFPYK